MDKTSWKYSTLTFNNLAVPERCNFGWVVTSQL